MAKKSAAQLKRLEKRAKDRGEVYVPQPTTQSYIIDTTDRDESAASSTDQITDRSAIEPSRESESNQSSSNSTDAVKLRAFLQLQKDLTSLEGNADLKAKERRSAKRKAEAIAVESCACATLEELNKWYEEVGKALEQQQQLQASKDIGVEKQLAKKKTIPYILFIGQLSYDTSKDDLFQHIKENLEKEHKVTESNIKIRLLQDMNTKKSRGMAFVEVLSHDPELMYACLKLHHTFLKGRRINVERSAGGGVQTRKMKIQRHRAEQDEFIDGTVKAMLQEYYDRGEIQRIGELDEGVIQLCKRHSTTVVQAALERYVESNGRDMDNPSAYLSFLLTKLAEEGIFNNRDSSEKVGSKTSTKDNRANTKQSSSMPKTKTRITDQKQSADRKKRKLDSNALNDSEFAKQGADMTVSQCKSELAKIFPSLSRGRGRGRGYM
jgi:RNA recognition motif-containing protein